VPVRQQSRVRYYFPRAAPEYYEVESQIGDRGKGRQSYRLSEPLKKENREHREDHQRDKDLVIAKVPMKERVLYRMLRGIGS
jgi:hypothetical protein